MNKNILVTGATGLIGTNLCKKLSQQNYSLTIFTRSPEKAKSILPYADEFIKWDYNNPEEWKLHLDDKHAVIHLAGANLAGKMWTDEYKKKIINSREKSTINLVNAIGEAEIKPKIFICASGTNFYGTKGEEILKEDSEPGDDFLSYVCKRWEEEAAKVEQYNVRRVSVRTGAVLSTKEGALNKFLTPFKLFVGGPLGNGKQWFSWIHLDDVINAYLFLLENENVRGTINVTSPNPVRMNDFAKTLGKVLNRPSLFRVPGWLIKLFFGEMAITVTGSVRAVPEKLKNAGFNFEHADLRNALKDIIKQHR